MEYVGLAIFALFVLAGAYLLTRLLRRSQEGDATRRGQDAAEPGGYYSDTYSGPD